MVKTLSLLTALLVFVGCAPRVPREVVSQVTFYGDFADLRSSPERYTGEIAILGGRVVEVQSDPSQTTLTVLQFPLDGSHRPKVREPSGGRFLVRSSSFLDPAVYGTGSLVTVAGTVAGGETRPIGAYPYTYPVLAMREIWRWEPEREVGGYPRFQFGIGIGKWF